MRVKILGSAAGGGFPQWNCSCPNCSALRAGTFRGKARTQTEVAISEDGASWFLLGASPDLRAQIEATPELHPGLQHEQSSAKKSQRGKVSPGQSVGGPVVRHSPIAGVVLANADVDHVLGLLLLRELQPLRVHCTKSVRRILTKDNSMFAMLQRVPDQVTWNEFTVGAPFSLRNAAGEHSGLRCRGIPFGEHYPAYVSAPRRSQLAMGESSLGLIVESSAGKRLAYLPAVPRIDKRILKLLDSVDVLLFDGTFWTADELIQLHSSTESSWDMGHVPVSSPEGSLSKLAQLEHPRKIYLHINNTNPMLNEAGTEYAQVGAAGWEIAEDGWEFNL
ncbi:MAG TPA: pyrroloquinoline quinone biosynthesis protein PqqB [Verrucomicrobiae bacterium]|jgi:pyrroloquinoline quinone biosynthesis protein B|nr:pyrroloquinoline quinone biosynthesis protein PqqB [Verrucomicrobiae bacterium]